MNFFQKFKSSRGILHTHNIPKKHQNRPTNTGVMIANTYNRGLKGRIYPLKGGNNENFPKIQKSSRGILDTHNIPKNHRNRSTNTGVMIANTYNRGLKGVFTPLRGVIMKIFQKFKKALGVSWIQITYQKIIEIGQQTQEL